MAKYGVPFLYRSYSLDRPQATVKKEENMTNYYAFPNHPDDVMGPIELSVEREVTDREEWAAVLTTAVELGADIYGDFATDLWSTMSER